MNDFYFLYVCVSDSTDNYYEQMLLSLISVKEVMPSYRIVLLTDNETFNGLIDFRSECKKYLDDIIVVDFPKEILKHKRSRLLKTSMRLHVDGNFLFIDTDTIIRKPIILDTSYELGAVLDCHVYASEYNYGQLDEKNIAIKLGYPEIDKYYMNSGVIFCKDSKITRNFFYEWNKLYEELYYSGIRSDQISYNIINYKFNNIITELDGKINCQIRFGAKYLADCSVFHYGGNGSREHVCILTKADAFDEMKEKKCVTETYLNYIKNPLDTIVACELMQANAPETNCDSFYMLRMLSWKHTTIFQIVNFLSKKLYQFKKNVFK